MKIKIEDSVAILTQIVENKMASEANSLIESALDAMVEFKSNYEIISCSAEPDDDADELLAEYGIYSWNEEEEERFEFDIVRQILLENDEEFYQLRIKLSYDKTIFLETDEDGFWSMDYTDIQEWEQEIKNTQAYQIAKQSDSIKYEISLDMT
ncbi:hypothetical protein [Bernardetia sp. MNP-M8]|uniref:hypothetical protein n=1 Tax=Bernardetia sp. MNP-M8 TaxID=3127470 RepID=UPI0030CF3320